MYASPLSIMILVIKTKSVEYMPFFLSLFVFLCGTSWLIYDPNGFGCALGEEINRCCEKDEKKTVEMKDEEKKQNVVNGKQQEQQIKKPVVCGIASLGYDHIEILGHTLAEISAEKAVSSRVKITTRTPVRFSQWRRTKLIFLTKERNVRRHGERSNNPATLIKGVDKAVRNRISSLRLMGVCKYTKAMETWFSVR
ncbi:hypothetical protein Bca4012_065204 [Brassica carinata]